MYGIMRSMIGVTNLIFSVSMLLLTIRFWDRLYIVLKIILIIAISLFTVIQPVMIYMGARKQVKTVPNDMEIHLDDEGLHIISSKEKSKVKWKDVKGITKVLDMIIIYSTEVHGFIISKRMLGSEKEDFYDYAIGKFKEHRK